MGNKKGIGLGLVVLMVAFLVVGMTGTAFAANPTPQGVGDSTMVGDPLGTNVSPHGGYDTSTDYCLQCHKQHGSFGAGASYNTGAYALLRNESVVSTCNTCHSLFAQGGGAAYDPGLTEPGGSIGTASSRAAYENGNPGGDITGGNGHNSIDADPGGTTSCPAGVANCTYPHVPSAGIDGVYGHKIGYGVNALGTITGGVYNSATRYTPNYDLQTWNALGTTTMPANSSVRSGPGTASQVAGGFYCGTCHTPHGADFGYAVNTEKGHAAATGWGDGNTIQWYNYNAGATAGVAPGNWGAVKLFSDTSEAYGWVVCASAAVSNADASCVPATTENEKGEVVSLYAYQLLTSGPNHQYQGMAAPTNVNLCSNGLPGTTTPATAADCAAVYGVGVTNTYTGTAAPGPQSYKIEAFNTDGAQWCGTCHSYALDTSLGGAIHAHPTGCNACHGNSTVPKVGEVADFPHSTETEAMLQELPDGLCITCHQNLP